MKKFIVLALALSSFAAAAQSISVRNTRYDVTVDVWNRQPREIRCSGPLTIYTMDGRSHMTSIYFPVRPMGSMSRWIRPTTGAPIRNVSHSIWCR